jgi:RNA polymerase primary sigma factor
MVQNTSHWIDQTEIRAYLADVKKYKVLTKQQEHDLLDKIKTGCKESKELLIKSNLRYIITVAKKYMNKGLPLADLINEGNYGLLKAAERYNVEQRDVRFLSYAIHWIKQSIIQALNEDSRLIQLPVNIINDLAKSKSNTFLESGAEVDKKIQNLPQMFFLDTNIDEDGGTYHDIIEDKMACRVDLAFPDDRNVISGQLNEILDKLKDNEQYVIKKYFGLDGDALTLQDISEDMKLTKERVRQIKERAINRLRFYSQDLFELL